MKKHLFLLFALFVNLCAFASKDVVPSDAVLAGYYDQGQVCVCFFVPADMACNDIVLTGSFNGWSSDVAECVRVEAVEGYDGWFVGSFKPEAKPDAEMGVQAKPFMLDVNNEFNWDYQVGAATILRGSMEIVQIMVGEIELINYGTDAPNVFTVDAWKKNPCTEPYHNYHFEVISDGCGGNVVPFIVGGMNLWKFEQMQLDEEKTVTNGAPTYYYNKKLPEGTEYQIASGMMDDNGVVPTEGDSAVGWKDIAYIQVLRDGEWVRLMREDNLNQITSEDANIVYDLREENLRWARCVPEPEDPRSENDSKEDIDITYDKYEIDNTYLEQYGVVIVNANKTLDEYNYRIQLQFYLPDDSFELVPGTYPIVSEDKFYPGSVIEGYTDYIYMYGSYLAKMNMYTGYIEFPLWFLAEGNVIVDDDLNISVDAINTNGAKIILKLSNRRGGSCGNNLTWTLNPKDRTLTIEGSGDMTSWSSYNKVPWYEYRSYIKSIYLPIGITNIGNYAFYGCSNLTHIEIPNDITSIGKSAFRYCSSLTSIEIPNKVTSIGNYAFSDCSSLTDIYVSCGDLARIRQMLNYDNRVKYIPLSYNITNYAVNGYVSAPQSTCDAIEVMAYPDYGYHFVKWSDGITDNPRAFELTQDTTFTSEFAQNPIITYVYDSNMGYIDGNTTLAYDSVGEVTFTAIPYNGYHFVQWSDGITDNPRTITLTKDTTFSAMFAADQSGKCGDNLVWALTDNALTIIGSGAMWDDQPWVASRESIKQINLPQGLTYIGNYAFEGLTSLTTLSIPSTVENVGRQPFYGCSNITSFVGPVVAFNSLYSEKVQSLTLNGGVLNDYNHLAPLSEVLERLDLSGADCAALPKRAFYDFYVLRELALPANLETIGYMSVAECVNLKKVEIPASVITIDQRAFENCRSLSDLTFAEGSKLETIDSWAFYNCHNLPKIEIPDGVTEIGDAAFYGCVYAESLKLPASIHSLGDNAFALCSKLNRMDVDAVVPPTIVAKTFNEVSRKAPVYVPDESVSLYKADPLWGEMNIVGQHESPTAVETISNDQLPITNKILRDGQILILRGEKVYTVTGQEVR